MRGQEEILPQSALLGGLFPTGLLELKVQGTKGILLTGRPSQDWGSWGFLTSIGSTGFIDLCGTDSGGIHTGFGGTALAVLLSLSLLREPQFGG